MIRYLIITLCVVTISDLQATGDSQTKTRERQITITAQQSLLSKTQSTSTTTASSTNPNQQGQETSEQKKPTAITYSNSNKLQRLKQSITSILRTRALHIQTRSKGYNSLHTQAKLNTDAHNSSQTSEDFNEIQQVQGCGCILS